MASQLVTRIAASCIALVSFVDLCGADDTIFAAYAFVRTGERQALLDESVNITTLTPFGAGQMLSLGNTFRSRYLTSNTTGIQDISVNTINQLQTNFLADDSQYSLASAQAFTSALYPPYNEDSQDSNGLANGTIQQYPFNGYQYPWIQSTSASDAISIFVDGSQSCYTFSNDQSYFTTQDYKNAQLNSEGLYSQAGAMLSNENFSSSAFDFNNAFGVYDYVNYEYNHNSTVRSMLANGSLSGDLQQLRAYSDLYQWGQYGQEQENGSPGTTLNTIAGQTFAFGLLNTWSQTILRDGISNTLSVLFGEFPAMMSFAALARLPAANQDFYGMPNYGSTMVFELFSPNSTEITDVDSLRVRFLFLNGTDTIDNEMPTQFNIYSTFGADAQDMSWNDFAIHLDGVSVSDPADWCGTCDSWDYAPFCMSWNSTAVNSANGARPTPSQAGFHGQLSPALAGAIGAVVTLAALCLFLVVAVGCCGMTVVRRKNKNNVTQEKSAGGTAGGLGGFKGSRRLASDPDLTDMSPTSPRRNDRVSGISFGNGDDQVMGHERVGSWELKAPKSAATRRDEEEGFGFSGLGKEVHPHENV